MRFYQCWGDFRSVLLSHFHFSVLFGPKKKISSNSTSVWNRFEFLMIEFYFLGFFFCFFVFLWKKTVYTDKQLSALMSISDLPSGHPHVSKMSIGQQRNFQSIFRGIIGNLLTQIYANGVCPGLFEDPNNLVKDFYMVVSPKNEENWMKWQLNRKYLKNKENYTEMDPFSNEYLYCQ